MHMSLFYLIMPLLKHQNNGGTFVSRELIGNYGNIVGSVHYFEQVNRENFVGNLMRYPQNTAYDNCL